MIYLRSIVFYIVEGLSTIPFMFLFMLVIPLEPKRRSKIIASWAHFITWWLKVSVGVKHEVIDIERIPEWPCVFACQHQSTWETIVTQTFLPPVAWVLKKELLRLPFFGWGLWASGPIAIDRSDQKNALDQVVEQGIEKIKEGRHVLIFPEGTRAPYGASGRYKKGAAQLARAANVPIVPIALNAGKYWSSESWWIKPGTIKCVFGPEISTLGRSDREITNEIQSWIESQAL